MPKFYFKFFQSEIVRAFIAHHKDNRSYCQSPLERPGQGRDIKAEELL